MERVRLYVVQLLAPWNSRKRKTREGRKSREERDTGYPRWGRDKVSPCLAVEARFRVWPHSAHTFPRVISFFTAHSSSIHSVAPALTGCRGYVLPFLNLVHSSLAFYRREQIETSAASFPIQSFKTRVSRRNPTTLASMAGRKWMTMHFYFQFFSSPLLVSP